MTISGLTSGAEYLRDAAQEFFNGMYGNPKMFLDEPLHKDLSWTPALRFTIHKHINIFVEVSETSPYPEVLSLKSNAVRNFQEPISIYSICPEDVKIAKKDVVKELELNGFGLITVDSNKQVELVFRAIPLIQIIPKSEFNSEIRGLSIIIRQRVSEAFVDYNDNPVNGVKSLTEILEGVVTSAWKQCLKKGYLENRRRNFDVATNLDTLYNNDRFQNIRGPIGGVRGYYGQYRHLSHHWPKNKKQAYKKYADCRHAFIDGIKQIQQFITAIRSVGLSVRLH